MSDNAENTIYQQLTLSVGVSLVKTLAKQTNQEPELTVNDQDYGENLGVLFASFNQDGLLLRTFGNSYAKTMVGTYLQFSGSFPTWGIMQNGQLYQRLRLALRNTDTGYSLWPTVLKSTSKRLEFSIEQLCKHSAKQKAKGNGAACIAERMAVELESYPTPQFIEWLMGFPQNWTEVE